MFLRCRLPDTDNEILVNTHNILAITQAPVSGYNLWLDAPAVAKLCCERVVSDYETLGDIKRAAVHNANFETVFYALDKIIGASKDIEPALSAIVDRLDTLAEVVESLKK